MTTYGSSRSAPEPRSGHSGAREHADGGAFGLSDPSGFGDPFAASRYDRGANGSRGVYGSAAVYGGGSQYGSNRATARADGARSSGKSGRPPSGGSRYSGGRGLRRTPWWAVLSLVVGVLVMLGGVGGMVATKYITGQVDSAINQVSLLKTTPGEKATSINGAINLLMIGLDTRANNPGLGSRADSIIIGHIPASHDRVDLISIPRDTYVPIPAYGPSRYPGGHNKINAAFQFGSQNGQGNRGGVQLLQQTIAQNWNLTFQGALIVNFNGFTDIVTKLGGVRMYVDITTKSLHHGYKTGHPNERAAPYNIHPDGTPGAPIPGTTPVIYTKGWHTLSAYEALDYVRCRDFLPNADYDRQRHQQQFVKALLQEAYSKGISNPLRISSFISSLGKAFQFDGGGHVTSDWIFTLKGISPGSIRTIAINGGTFNTVTVGTMSTQQMSPLSLQLLDDVRTDQVENFLAVHPDWVTSS